MPTTIDIAKQLHGVDSLAADSLHLPVEEHVVDSLSGVGYENFSLSDAAAIEAQSEASEIYRDTTADAVFGSDATVAEGVQLVQDGLQADVDVSLSNIVAESVLSLDMILGVSIFVVMAAYLFCLHRYYYDVVALIHSSWQRNAPTNRDDERRRSDIFYGFLGKLFLLGVGFVGVFASIWAIRHGGLWLNMADDYRSLTPFAGMLLFVALVLVQYVMLLLAGFVTRSISFVSSLMRMRLVYFVFATIAVAPLLLVAQLTDQSATVWSVVTCLVAFVVLILYLRESVELFISKKISILHWILYLCAVEIMPITLLWQVVVRLS